jgi:hypothetical protein
MQYAASGYDSGDGPNFLKADLGDGHDKKGRKENGLVELTKKFIDMLKNDAQQNLDLNIAVT